MEVEVIMQLRMLMNDSIYNEENVLKQINNLKKILHEGGKMNAYFALEKIEGCIKSEGVVNEKIFRLIKMNTDIRALGDVYLSNIEIREWWRMLTDLVKVSGVVCYKRILQKYTNVISTELLKEKIDRNKIVISYKTSKELMEILDEYKKIEQMKNDELWFVDEKKVIFKDEEIIFIVKKIRRDVYTNSILY